MSGLDPALREALTTFAGHPSVLYGTDFDGVLAPLVQDPTTSAPLPGSVDALRGLATLPGTTVALVSGRDLDTLRRLSGVSEDEPVVLVGSHGAQPSIDLPTGQAWDEAAAERLARVTRVLQAVSVEHPGTHVERKAAGAALHTRGMPPCDAERAEQAALSAAESMPEVHVIAGKNVVEIGVLDTSKGLAMTALAGHVGAEVACYLGDDVTDETAFEVLPRADGHVCVKVGEGPTAAPYRVADPDAALDVLLTALEVRRAATSARQPD